MKRCPWCGKDYPDAATHCQIDRYALEDVPTTEAQLELPLSAGKSESPPLPAVPYRPWPNYSWSAGDGWKALVMIVILWLIQELLLGALGTALPGFRRWHSSPVGFAFGYAMHFALSVLVVSYFARTETLPSFGRAMGLISRPTGLVWFGLATALLLRGFGHLAMTQHWSHGSSAPDLQAFRHSTNPLRFLFLVPLLLFAPLCEEIVNRGFLFKAFRCSYPYGLSATILVVWTALTHINQYSISWAAALDLSLLTLMQCYLREKSASLWDCILCHLVFNASGLFVAHVINIR